MTTRATATATPQPQGRLTAALECILGGIAWTTQTAAAITYLIIAFRPSVWQPFLATDPVGAVCTGLFTICMAGLWMISLREEKTRFYDRRAQRTYRRAGLLGHLSVLFIAAVSASYSPDRVGWWAVLGALCFSAVATWVSWTGARFLPDEDQAVIDAIISREAAQRAAVHDASEREKRHVRLTAIVEGLGYTLTDTPAQTGKQADAPTIKWTVPAGKHKPLVYFIRNGNRMKIGTTTELKRRIRTLALRAENVTLLFDGDQSAERAFHKQFAEHRIGNTEWFAYEGTLAEFVTNQVRQASQKEQGQ